MTSVSMLSFGLLTKTAQITVIDDDSRCAPRTRHLDPRVGYLQSHS